MGMENLQPPSKNLVHPKYRPDIDGLRAIAVLAVVGFHAFGVQGGFAGVDIFFVISGYLISTIIFENLENNSFKFSEFYVRRIKRIFPALATVMLGVLVAGYFLLVDDEYAEVGKHLSGGATFISNLVLWNESGYFNTDAELKPLLHLWSLGIEEQFYLFWPLLVWMFWSFRFGSIFVVLAILLASFGFNVYLIGHDTVGAFYLPFTRFWELLVGSLLAYIHLRRKPDQPFSKTTENILSVLGGLLIITCFFILNKKVMFPGWWALLPVIGAALIIFSSPQALFNRILSARLLVWFGLISFPLYLWHWPLLAFLRILGGDRPSSIQRIVAVLLAIFLALLTYQFLEKPIRKNNAGNKITFFLLALIATIGTLGFGIYKTDGFPYRSASQYSLSNKATDKTLKNVHFNNGLDRVDERCKKIEGLGNHELYCQILSDHPTLLIVGDSHAISFAYSSVLQKNPNVAVVAANGCLPVLGFVGTKTYEIFSNREQICQGMVKDALRVAKSFPSIQNIIFINGGIRYLGGKLVKENFKFVKLADGKPVSNEYSYLQGFEDTIPLFQKLGKQIILTVDVPIIGRSPEECVDIHPYRFGQKPIYECTIDRGVSDANGKQYLSLVRQIASQLHDVLVFDTTDIFCDELKCYGIKGDSFYYYDGEHLGFKGSQLAWDRLSQWLNERQLLRQ